MSNSPSQNQEKFMLRLPDGMRERIKVEAEKNNRSMNAEIAFRLEKSLKSDATIVDVKKDGYDLDIVPATQVFVLDTFAFAEFLRSQNFKDKPESLTTRLSFVKPILPSHQELETDERSAIHAEPDPKPTKSR